MIHVTQKLYWYRFRGGCQSLARGPGQLSLLILWWFKIVQDLTLHCPRRRANWHSWHSFKHCLAKHGDLVNSTQHTILVLVGYISSMQFILIILLKSIEFQCTMVFSIKVAIHFFIKNMFDQCHQRQKDDSIFWMVLLIL